LTAASLQAANLGAAEVDNILQDEMFRENLVLLGIDEAHVLVPWGKVGIPANPSPSQAPSASHCHCHGHCYPLQGATSPLQ